MPSLIRYAKAYPCANLGSHGSTAVTHLGFPAEKQPRRAGGTMRRAQPNLGAQTTTDAPAGYVRAPKQMRRAIMQNEGALTLGLRRLV